MKKIISAFLCFILLYLIAFSAFSFKIDGIDNGTEWDGSYVYEFIDGESNCNIDFGIVKIKFDHDTDALYFCFLFTDPDLKSDNSYSGVSLSIDGAPAYEITSCDSVYHEGTNDYSFDGAITIDNNTGATCEIRVGFKSGLPKQIDCSVQYIDSHGDYSNYYDFTVINELYKETGNLIINPSGNNTEPDYESDKTSRETTSKKTTTQKASTRKSTTTKVNDEHRKPTTTEYTLPYVEIKTSPLYTGRTTVKRTTEKPEITTVKVTKAPKTEKEPVKVYYYEKEVYVSEVYITQPPIFTTDDSFSTFTEDNTTTELTDFANINESAEIENTYETDKTIGLSTGSKIKTVIGAFSLLGFAAIAVFGILSAKKGDKIAVKKRKK